MHHVGLSTIKLDRVRVASAVSTSSVCRHRKIDQRVVLRANDHKLGCERITLVGKCVITKSTVTCPENVYWKSKIGVCACLAVRDTIDGDVVIRFDMNSKVLYLFAFQDLANAVHTLLFDVRRVQV